MTSWRAFSRKNGMPSFPNWRRNWGTSRLSPRFGAVCYTPQGSVYGMSIGQTSSFTGFNISETFNSRLQPSEIKASSSAGNAIDITYNFVDPVSGGNAGHVYGVANNLNSSRSQAFTYDQVNRILSAGTTATTGTYCWGYKYSYDAWGNLLSQAGWSPTYNACTEGTMGTVTADGNNHISGFSYDSSGNTLGDGNYTYTWDGESQMKTAAGVTYAYDGDGRRAAKVGSKLYWYGSGGEILAETDAAGNTLNEYVFFGGKRVAVVPASGSALYYAEDSLGSSRVIVQSNGTVCYDADFTPFGGERSYTSTCPQNYKFEGKERDTETQNDDFGARYYSWRFGRWLSSDWSAVPVAVPYANLTNPQTLNLYSMVADDPESFADLDGHVAGDTCPECITQGQAESGVNDTKKKTDATKPPPPPPPAQNNGHVTAKAKGQTVTYTYPDGSKVKLKGTHAWRDNNPGDLKSGYGSIGRDGRGKHAFAIYASAADGWDALGQTLTGKYADSTIADTMKHFAPASDSNDPVKYAATLAESVGVPVSTKISALSPAQFTTVEINIGVAEGYFAPKNTEAYSAPSQ